MVATVEQVSVEWNALDAQMCDAITIQHPDMYPDMIPMDDRNGHSYAPIPTSSLFDLRASDIKRGILPETLNKGAKAMTVMIAGDYHAGKHMETSVELATERDADKVQKDQNQAQADPKDKGKGKAPASAPADVSQKMHVDQPTIPSNEVVKAYFHLDTQTPHIELLALDATTGRTISCRLFAHDINWDPEVAGRVGFRVEKYQPDPTVDRTAPKDEPENESKQLIEKMSQSFQQTCLIKVTIFLNSARIFRHHWEGSVGTFRHQWEGITDSDIAAVRADPDFTLLRDNFITALEKQPVIELYFTSKSGEGYTAKWEKKFGNYMRDLLTLAKYYGNFWFYRWQCQDAGLNANAILQPEFPNVDWIVPRWLVTDWNLTKTTTPDGTITYSEPRPYLWTPLEFPEYGYNDPNEAAFLLKMGVHEGRSRQKRDLSEVVQSDGSKWFKGRFRSLDKKNRSYAVEVFLGLDPQLMQDGLRMPSAGTRIHMEVDHINAEQPSKQNTIALDGVVVYDALQTTASFIVVVNVYGPPLDIADDDNAYHLFISYIMDELPHQRMMNGIAQLQLSGKFSGPDSRRTVLGCKVPAQGTNVLKTKTDEAACRLFEAAMAEVQPPSDERQTSGSLQTMNSDSGNVVIVGPPGTGKTATIMKIGHAHATLGRRVMYVAPLNANVHTLVDKFIQINTALPFARQYQEHEWVYFTGGYVGIEKAEKLRQDQLAGEDALNHANEKLFGYLQDAKERSHVPRYEQTLGYKLRHRIDAWASDECIDTEQADLHTQARSFLEAKEELPSLKDKDQRTQIKKRIRELEYNLSLAFLKGVKFCFCTLSTSGHQLILESGDWDLLIIDEAAHETRAGISVALGALAGRVKLIVWAGDHHQGEGVIVGAHSNVGYKLLSRNVFRSMAETDKKDSATPCEVTLLNICYRMDNRLIRWSSAWCYNNQIISHRRVGSTDMGLRNMLQAYWRQRFPDNFGRHWSDLGLDVTDIGVATEFMKGTTTKLNREEAKMIARTVLDMLTMAHPEVSPNQQLRRIEAKDIGIIANYSGQIMEIRRAIRERARELSVEQEDLATLSFATTAQAQGREFSIMFYSMVIATGEMRLPKESGLPIGFVSKINNLNVSITRCKIARYTVGALQLFAQANRDHHSVTRNRRNLGFFDFVNRLVESRSIVTLDESNRWFESGEKPVTRGGFAQRLLRPNSSDQKPAEKKGEPAEKPKRTRRGGLGGKRKKAKRAAAAAEAAEAEAEFSNRPPSPSGDAAA
ncbi:hypothetical protein N0V83_008951 [Neocucurbitaria cava]|uniref:AAA+ ATPase domain-containing protein n=1 Tax=Neocucurbitaria cava TaxID=798079 RepID=A0A9W8Y1D8_9PLEO|nr:hypothetical protein N0V83_008951 [Neocucurbitaria cava]